MDRKKESAIVDLYSAQFEYDDLVSRLNKIKKSSEIGAKRLFKSFDSSMNVRPTYLNKRERVRIKPVNKPRVRSNAHEKRMVKKPKHLKSTSDKFYQSELIPLYTPGFKVYNKNNLSMSRRLNS